MEIRCPSCHEIFKADPDQELFIGGAIQRGQRLIMTDCPQCYKHIPINPADLLSMEAQKDGDKKNSQLDGADCPVCTDGIVSYIDDGNKKFWGCGECGNVWFSEKDLHKSVLNKKS
ncbi:hypothetical protein [Chryseobacterium viscerum]|uniref:Transcription factor zinc-finger domain-containing protein n=1 Tax=Chryseobacterium viscerum TaxID=1037377 RepID=A0A5N4BS96_9FLAO|nr:hypothetical protein [Chryseobacterium viscerum]KAB1231262.1 hypothetical protein F8D52_09355 [Chryseobacterium viscerum]